MTWFILSLLFAAEPSALSKALVGTWTSQDKDAKIDMYPCGQFFCGRIVWLKEPKTDENNPNLKLRSRPVLQLEILTHLRFDRPDHWEDGSIYDPKTGNTYHCAATLRSNAKLELRGFVGMPLFGRTAVWTR